MPREVLRDIQNLLVTVAEPGIDLRSSHFSLLSLAPSTSVAQATSSVLCPGSGCATSLSCL